MSLRPTDESGGFIGPFAGEPEASGFFVGADSRTRFGVYEATFTKLGGGRLVPSPMCRFATVDNRHPPGDLGHPDPRSPSVESNGCEVSKRLNSGVDT